MTNQSSQTNRLTNQQKAQPSKSQKRAEAVKKPVKSKIARVVFNKSERSRVHGAD